MPILTGSLSRPFLGSTTNVLWEINFRIRCHSFPTSETKIKSVLDHGGPKGLGWEDAKLI